MVHGQDAARRWRLIARKLSVSRADLAEANYLKTTARVAAGQKLMVPHETTVLMAARTERPVPVADSRPLAADTLCRSGLDRVRPRQGRLLGQAG